MVDVEVKSPDYYLLAANSVACLMAVSIVNSSKPPFSFLPDPDWGCQGGGKYSQSSDNNLFSKFILILQIYALMPPFVQFCGKYFVLL